MGLQIRTRLTHRFDALRKSLFPQSHVLLYHRVADTFLDREYLCLSPKVFEVQIKFLKVNYHMVSLEELCRRNREGRGQNCLSITFDDGFADNAVIAAAILKKHEAPATFFIATGEIGSERENWTSDLERVFFGSPGDWRPFEIKFLQGTVIAGSRDEAYQKVFKLFLQLTAGQREKCRAQLYEYFQISPKGRTTHCPMTIDQIKSLAVDPLFSIGAHTVSHAQLSSLPEDQQREEIVRSKQQLEGWTQKPVKFFAYPFGQRIDYNQTSVRLCREAGFLGATTAYAGCFDRFTSPWEMPRCNPRHGVETILS